MLKVEHVIGSLHEGAFCMDSALEHDYVPEVIGHAMHTVVHARSTCAGLSVMEELRTLYRTYHTYKQSESDNQRLTALLKTLYTELKQRSDADMLARGAYACLERNAPLFEQVTVVTCPSAAREYLASSFETIDLSYAALRNATAYTFREETLLLYDALVHARLEENDQKRRTLLVDSAALFLLLWYARGGHPIVRGCVWTALQSVAMQHDEALTENGTLPRHHRWFRVLQCIEDASMLVDYDRDLFGLYAIYLLVVGDDATVCLALENEQWSLEAQQVQSPQEEGANMADTPNDQEDEDEDEEGRDWPSVMERTSEWLSKSFAQAPKRDIIALMAFDSVSTLIIEPEPAAKSSRSGTKRRRDPDGETTDDASESARGSEKRRLDASSARIKYHHLPTQRANAPWASDVFKRVMVYASPNPGVPQAFIASCSGGTGTGMQFVVGPFLDSRQSAAVRFCHALRQAIALPDYLPVAESCAVWSLRGNVYNRSSVEYDVVLEYVVLSVPNLVPSNVTGKVCRIRNKSNRNSTNGNSNNDGGDGGEPCEAADWRATYTPGTPITSLNFETMTRESIVRYLFTLAWRYVMGMRGTTQRAFYKDGPQFLPHKTYDHWEVGQFSKVKKMYQRSLGEAVARNVDEQVQTYHEQLQQALQRLRRRLIPPSPEVRAVFASHRRTPMHSKVIHRLDALLTRLQRDCECEDGFWRSLM